MPDTPATPATADGTPIIDPAALLGGDTNDPAATPAPGVDPAALAEEQRIEQEANRTDAEIDAIARQADNPDAVARALRSERTNAQEARREAIAVRTENEELRSQVREYQRRDMTDTERVLAERDELRGQIDPTRQENMRLRAAIAKSVPADLIDRLRGDTQEELERDAEALMQRLGNQPPTPPAPDFHGGAQPRDGVAGGQSMDDEIRRAAGRS